jgi:hypothetical protein
LLSVNSFHRFPKRLKSNAPLGHIEFCEHERQFNTGRNAVRGDLHRRRMRTQSRPGRRNGFSMTTLIRPAATFSRSRERRNNGVVLLHPKKRAEASGGFRLTTNTC